MMSDYWNLRQENDYSTLPGNDLYRRGGSFHELPVPVLVPVAR